LTLALVVTAAGIFGSFGVYHHGVALSPAQHHYLAGDGVPVPPKS
jgi:hypothetical protein